MLGLEYTSIDNSVIDTAYNLIEHGLVANQMRPRLWVELVDFVNIKVIQKKRDKLKNISIL